MAHTPGPWQISGSIDWPKCGGTSEAVWAISRSRRRDYGRRVCTLTKRAVSEQEANGRLIAKAPEMLDQINKNKEALELVRLWMLGGQPGPHNDQIVLEQVTMAIDASRDLLRSIEGRK